MVQRFPSARIFRAIPTCIFPALWYNRKAPIRVQCSCLGGMRLRVQRSCFGGMCLRAQRSCLGGMRLRVRRSCFGGMRLRVQRSCFGGMHLRVQRSCFGSAVAASGTEQGETPQSLVTPVFAGFPPVAESGIKAALTTGMTTGRKIFDFPLRRGIMAEIEYPGVAQLVGRHIWENTPGRIK